MKPRLFVASSVEGLDVAYAVQENLQHDFEVTVWAQGVFEPSKRTLDSLASRLQATDAAVFVFSPDDRALVRGQEKPAIRDNVLFELGLFIGRLGPDKCFVLKPASLHDVHLPSDLFGFSPATYEEGRSDDNYAAATGPACHQIRRALKPPAQAPVAAMPAPIEPHQRTKISLSDAELFAVSTPLRLFYNPPRKGSKRMVLEEGGRIFEGGNRNESSWRVVEGRLEFLDQEGNVHSRFTFNPTSERFDHTNDADTHSLRDQYMIEDS